MSNENEGTLQKLKALALGDKQPRTDTLELGPEMIAAQDQEDIDDLDMHEEGIEITAEAQIEADVEDAEELTAPPPPPVVLAVPPTPTPVVFAVPEVVVVIVWLKARALTNSTLASGPAAIRDPTTVISSAFNPPSV